MAEGFCEICGQPATSRCSRCHNTFYCSLYHETIAWPAHSELCWPFKVVRTQSLQRKLIAKSNIEEGSVIITESPLITGPQFETDPVCLGCLNKVTIRQGFTCRKCGFRFCNEECSKRLEHLPECYYISKFGKKLSARSTRHMNSYYYGILIIRCFFLYRKIPHMRKAFDKLDVQHTRCEGYDDSIKNEMNIVKKCICKKLGLEKVFPEESIEKMYRIIKSYAHTLPTVNSSPFGIYYLSSLAQQNCRSNCYHNITSDGKMQLIAGTEIKEGEQLTACYVSPLLTTMERQVHLRKYRFLRCSCKRCTDVTEFGTNYSALKCQKPKCEGVLYPESFLEESQEWTCNACQYKMAPDIVVKLFDSVRQRCFSSTELLECDKQLLTPNHCYMLCEMYRNILDVTQQIDGDLKLLCDAALFDRIQQCYKIVNVLQVLIPAQKHQQGIILHRLEWSLSEGYRRKLFFGPLCSSEKVIKILQERKRIANEVIKSMMYSCERMVQSAKADLREIDEEMSNVFRSL